MAAFRDYDRYDALGLAELIATRQVRPAEALEAAIERLEAVNPKLNAVVHKMYDEAERSIAAGLPAGPLAGVPFLLKDLGALYAGQPTSFGSALYDGFVADHDTTLVERYRAAGLVIFGKTNTPEMGLAATTEPARFGPTRNPWNLERTPGGSSGGATAAVAAGVVPAAHASDGGGSIRIPCSACGLVGLKPTRARNPAGPDVGEGWSGLATAHVASRTVRDSAAFLDASHGPARGDPYYAPAPARPFSDEVGADPGRLRVAFSTATPNGVPVDAECVRAVEDAVALLQSLGHEVAEDAPCFNFAGLMRHMTVIWGANTWHNVALRCRALGREPDGAGLEATTWGIAQRGRSEPASAYAAAIQAVHALGRIFGRFQKRYDVFVTPTLAQPPVKLGNIDMGEPDPERYLDNMLKFMPFTAQINCTGQPAATLPLHMTSDGLPVGVQFIARFGDEATLLRLASQIEAARPWAERRPPA
jgi:Asp-tRNA(Asn)/Glu-tRNA(Gln) amidotransferase A subunit family amidase